MVRRCPTGMERLVLLEVCPLCRAAAGVWCSTAHHGWSPILHHNRWQVSANRAAHTVAEAMNAHGE